MMQANSNLSSGASGFTLLEMLVVIAIIAIGTTIAMPALMRPSDRLLLEQTLAEIRSALRATRSAAIATNRAQVLTIDTKERSFASAVVSNSHFSPKIEAQIKVAEPERISSSRGGIRFFPDGSSTGGEVTLSVNARQAMLCVHWLTGQPVEGANCSWSKP
jgi:general secretion pathway protein H